MNKKVRLIIIIVAVLAVAILVFSYFYPHSQGDDASGTIGKADKYRKDQMSAQDILLRDDILQDTAAVRKTLLQLLEFTAYSVEVKKVIDSAWIIQLKANCGLADCDAIISPLSEYSEYITNNIPLMNKTNGMLADCYYQSKNELPKDAGSQLLSFISFVDQFLQRDSVFDQTIQNLDKYIQADRSKDKKRKTQVTNLRNIRDKMVIDNLLFAVNTGDEKKYEYSSAQTLYNVNTIKSVNGAGNLNVGDVCNSPVIKALTSSPNLQVFVSSNPVIMSKVIIPAVNRTENVSKVKSGISVSSGATLLSKEVLKQIESGQNLSNLQGQPINNVVIPISNFNSLSSGVSVQLLRKPNLTGTVFNENIPAFNIIEPM
ncbi:MAG: hypothetical protein AB9842_05520 [Bacteroidales bacterium]